MAFTVYENQFSRDDKPSVQSPLSDRFPVLFEQRTTLAIGYRAAAEKGPKSDLQIGLRQDTDRAASLPVPAL